MKTNQPYSKVMALSLTVFLIISLYPINTTHANDDTEISTCLELQAMNENKNGSYILVNDIECGENAPEGNDTTQWDDGAGFVPIGDIETQFAGSLNGQGFAIKDLYINRPETDGIGLFGYTNDATIQNLGLANANITGRSTVGGLIANQANGQLTYAYVTGSVTGVRENHDNTSAEAVGGLVGIIRTGGSISTAYSLADVTGYQYVGGLVGYSSIDLESSITESYAAGEVIGNQNLPTVNGLVGLDWNVAITDSYYDSETTGQTTPDNATKKTTEEMMTQSTFDDWTFTVVGNGTIGDWIMAGYPHLQLEHRTTITSAVELQMMAIDLSANYSMANNIDASGVPNYLPVGNLDAQFIGTLDGNGHRISNLYIYQPNLQSAGIFGFTSGTFELSELGITNGEVTGNRFVGGLVGYNQGLIKKSFSNTSVAATTIELSSGEAGGLVGVNIGGNAIIHDSYANSTVTSTFDVGGLVGYNQGTLIRTYANGTLENGINNGGLVGRIELSTIEDSFAISNFVGGTNRNGIIAAVGEGGAVQNSYWLTLNNIELDCHLNGNDGCTEVEDSTLFFDAENPPLDEWNFETVWRQNEETYPTLDAFGDLIPPVTTITPVGELIGEMRYTNISPVEFIITFDEDVINFDEDKLVITNGTLDEVIQVEADEYSILIIPDEIEEGEQNILVQLGIHDGIAEDLNGNPAANDSPKAIQYDPITPTGQFTSETVASGQTTSTSVIPFTLTFSEEIDNFDQENIIITAGTINNFEIITADTVFTFNVTPNSSGSTVTLSIPEGTVTDYIGNENEDIPIYSFTYIRPNSSSGSSGSLIIPQNLENQNLTEIDSNSSLFTDINEHWSKEFIQELKEKCKVSGYSDSKGNLLNIFGPDNLITRAELVKMILGCKFEKSTSTASTTPFTDIEATSWYAPYINYAFELGWIEGYEDGTFKPNSPINRSEALKIVISALYPKFTTSSSDTLTNFTDTDPESWYAPYLKFAIESDIIEGYEDGTFKPNSPITRGETAKIIILFLQKI